MVTILLYIQIIYTQSVQVSCFAYKWEKWESKSLICHISPGLSQDCGSDCTRAVMELYFENSPAFKTPQPNIRIATGPWIMDQRRFWRSTGVPTPSISYHSMLDCVCACLCVCVRVGCWTDTPLFACCSPLPGDMAPPAGGAALRFPCPFGQVCVRLTQTCFVQPTHQSSTHTFTQNASKLTETETLSFMRLQRTGAVSSFKSVELLKKS